ncbi:MAG TPA: ATP-dependent sacrificial sulfur transferase LarE [Gemmatimonadales bacterium]|nr:ATP-dependent sacrificial sulfur transferase LarE [Gemmatimonadales bacterium]
MPSLAALGHHVAGLGRVLLGYSGGVDSALLAVVSTRALGSGRFLAVLGRSASYPEAQWCAAVDIAGRFGVPLLELDTHELDDARYVANTPDRCYFCKSELWSRLDAVARERGFDVVIDGTNADDLGEHRPGLRAAGEHAVRSPLADLGWTKADIRSASRALGLPSWDAPASPCLSSRVRYGLAVTPQRLRQVEAGEAYLRRLGVTGDLRVRHHGATARVETAPEEHGTLRARWDAVRETFAGLGFAHVELDPHGYRRGSLLAILPDSGH